MDLDRMAFDFIEKLITEGDYKMAAVNLWNISKANRMRKLTNKLAEIYYDAIEHEGWKNVEAVDKVLVKLTGGQIAHELEVAFAAIKRKEGVKIPYPKTMKFGYKFDEEKLSKKEKEVLYNRISTIRDMGFGVDINKAS